MKQRLLLKTAILVMLALQIPVQMVESQTAQSERQWLSHCMVKIQKHFREPRGLSSDSKYKKMRIELSFFLNKDGSIACLEFNKNETLVRRDTRKIVQKVPAFVALSNSHQTRQIENALSTAVKNSQPLPTEDFQCDGPYFMTLAYSPGSKIKWELIDCPPPAHAPIVKFK